MKAARQDDLAEEAIEKIDLLIAESGYKPPRLASGWQKVSEADLDRAVTMAGGRPPFQARRKLKKWIRLGPEAVAMLLYSLTFMLSLALGISRTGFGRKAEPSLLTLCILLGVTATVGVACWALICGSRIRRLQSRLNSAVHGFELGQTVYRPDRWYLPLGQMVARSTDDVRRFRAIREVADELPKRDRQMYFGAWWIVRYVWCPMLVLTGLLTATR